MRILSPGKIRSLQACATPQGIFTILAADHRDALRAMIAPEAPQRAAAETLTDIKLAIVHHLAAAASAVLLDPLYGAAQAVVGGHLPGAVGLLCALEEQGYLGEAASRRTPLLADWGVEKAKRLGANGVKMLLFYHPEAGAAAEAQEQLVASIADDCRRYDLPFFLEPIAYALDPQIKKGSPEFARLRRRIVIESVRRLSALGPEVMKVEFPVDAAHETDPRLWAEACAEVNEASAVPWTLLSAGEPFETFKAQLRAACSAGCSGFVAGRALWREAVGLSGDERRRFLTGPALQRLRELTEIALKFGAPWPARFAQPQVDEHWFQRY